MQYLSSDNGTLSSRATTVDVAVALFVAEPNYHLALCFILSSFLNIFTEKINIARSVAYSSGKKKSLKVSVLRSLFAPALVTGWKVFPVGTSVLAGLPPEQQ